MRKESFSLWIIAMALLTMALMVRMVMPDLTLVIILGAGSTTASILIVIESELHKRRTRIIKED